MKLSREMTVAEAANAIDILAAAVPELSKARLKDAMLKGAVLWFNKPVKRLRRAQTQLPAGAKLALNYDADLLQRQTPPAILLFDQREYSVWFKPPGMLSQGNEWGDHLSLVRFAEQQLQSARPVFLLHRLDREASGLVMLAHSKKAAAALSQLIAKRQIGKSYWIRVKGELAPELQQQGVIQQALDGKASESRFKVLNYDVSQDCSECEVLLITGRKHQIRRHFAAAGHPVMGDPQYGKGNKSAAGLALQAITISFFCPLTRREQKFELPAHLRFTAS